MEQWFLVGFADCFGQNDGSQVWPIWDTLENVADRIESVNKKRVENGWQKIIGRMASKDDLVKQGLGHFAEMDEDLIYGWDCDLIHQRFILVSSRQLKIGT